MSKNLFNINAEYLDILDQVAELDGELTPELEIALKINELELESKIKAYYYYIKQNESDSKLLGDEIERLKGKQKSLDNTNARLKESIKEALLLHGVDGKSGNKTLKYTDLTVYNVYNKPLKFEVEEEDFIKEYEKSSLNIINKKTLFSIDKKRVKEYIENQQAYVNKLFEDYPNYEPEDLLALNNDMWEEFTSQNYGNLQEFYDDHNYDITPNPIQYIIPEAYIDEQANYVVMR